MPSSSSRSHYKQILAEYYGRVRPDKLDEIDTILTSFEGQEENLLRALEEKYRVPVSRAPSSASTSTTATATTTSVSQKMDSIVSEVKKAVAKSSSAAANDSMGNASNNNADNNKAPDSWARLASTIVSLAVQLQYAVVEERESLRAEKEAFEKQRREFIAMAEQYREQLAMPQDVMLNNSNGSISASASPRTLYVRADLPSNPRTGCFATVAAAVEACRDGDSIHVHAGRYLDAVKLTNLKGVGLIGVDTTRENVVLAVDTVGCCLHVHSSEVSLNNLSIVLSGDDTTGLVVSEDSDVTLTKVDVLGGGVGVTVSKHSKISMVQCTVKSCAHVGVAGTDMCALALQDCVISHMSGTGVVAAGASLHVRACEVVGNGADGILATGGARGIIEYSSIGGNGGSGVSLEGNSAVLVSGNTIQENRGFGVCAVGASVAECALLNNNLRGNIQGDATPGMRL